jgi:hypothetical protein
MRNAELTAAFKDPKILSAAKDFIQINARFALTYHLREATGGNEALLVGLEMNWIGLLALLLSNLIVCLGAGLVAGLLTERIDLGVAVTSGMASVVACIEAVLFLVYK